VGRKRLKPIAPSELSRLVQGEGNPLKLERDEWPEWTRGIPPEKVHSVWGSATLTASQPYHSAAIASASQNGGYDIYRFAPDDPVSYNKDWYPIVMADGQAYADGPFRDSEHWLNQLPSRLFRTNPSEAVRFTSSSAQPTNGGTGGEAP